MAKHVDFYFALNSRYSYLAASRRSRAWKRSAAPR